MNKIVLAAVLSCLTVVAANAQSQMEYLAQAVSTMQATNAKCGFGLSDQAILAGSTQLGGQPSDPAFVAAVARRREAFEANLTYLTEDMLADLCRDSRALLTQMGL